MANSKKQDLSIPNFFEPDTLGSHADINETQSVRHYFTDTEMGSLRLEFFQINLHKARREEIVDKVKTLVHSGICSTDLEEQFGSVNCADIGEQSMKVLKQQFSDLLLKIRSKYEDREVKLWGVAFHDIGRMAYYREDGHFEYDRPLRPEERQGSILSLSNAI